MKLRHLLDELEKIKVKFGEERFEQVINFDFLVDIVDENYERVDQTQNIGIYLDDIFDECQIVAYVKKENIERKEC